MVDIVENIALGQAPSGKITPAGPTAPAAPVNRASTVQPGRTAPTDRTSAAQPSRAAPTDRTSTAQPSRAAPNTIATRPGDPDAPPFALNHARILYASVLAGSSVSVSAGTGAANVLNPATYNRWSFTGPATLTITLPAAQSIDAVGLGAHNFSGAVVAVDYSTSDGGAWVSFAANQTGREAMLFLSSSAVSAKRLRVTVTGSGALVLGVVYAGVALQMQRPVYRGVEPPTMARSTEYQSTVSEGGQWLGRNVIRQNLKVAFSWKNLSAAWVRTYLDPFIKSAVGSPFFIAWNPQEFPREVAYAWSTDDMAPANTGPRDLMSVSLKAQGAA